MFVVAGIKLDGFAIEAVVFGAELSFSLLFTDIATKFDNFLMITLRASGDVVVGAGHIAEHVIHITLEHHASLFVSRDLFAVVEATHTESYFAFFVKVVLISFRETSHASQFVLNLVSRRVFLKV